MALKRKIDIWSLKTPCTNWRSHYSEWLKCLSIMQSAQFFSSWFPWKSMDPLTFDSDLMFALIIFQLYGQKWEETASEIENHFPLYQPSSICLLTNISRKDLPLLFNHSSSSSFVIVKKNIQIQCSQFFRGRFSFWFFCLLFIYRVSQNESSSLNFEGDVRGLDFWQKSGLPPNSFGIVLG